MTQLVAALHTLGLDGEIALSGHWVKLHGERCCVYVAEPTRGGKYYTWCDAAGASDVEAYNDPVEAIQAGLRRAAQRDPEQPPTELQVNQQQRRAPDDEPHRVHHAPDDGVMQEKTLKTLIKAIRRRR